MKIDDNYISNVLKAELLLTDYTFMTSLTDKNLILEIMSRYIYNLQDNKLDFIYAKICDSMEEERELYVEMLGDLISECKLKLGEVR